ncbi:MAG: hypothetical protein CUR32_10350 [Flavobacterium sp.]|nr:MAG: hypothetical protein CUR32_10350 [Flavobacterium sp.] [Flavobacterium sp. FEMGT703F]
MKDFNTQKRTTLNFLLLAIFLLIGGIEAYSQSQTRIARVGENNSAGRIWNNIGNITADDLNYATAALAGNETSRYLRARDFGFTIPTGATITGITANIMRQSSSNTGGNSVNDNVVRLIKNLTLVVPNYASAADWPTSMSAANYGVGTTDLWGTTWTDTDINNPNFGLVLRVTNESNNNRTASVDYIEITVYYTNPIPTITNFTPNNACVNSGTTVTITGTNFTGATNVTFNGTAATFTVNSNTQITAVLPNGASTGNISVITPNGTANSSTSFTVNALPTVNPINGNTILCPNTSTILSSTTTGGTWSSANSSVATINSSGQVSALTAGSSVITYTITDGNNCSNTANTTVTVQAKPVLSGPNAVCVGNSIQLNPTLGGTWISNHPLIATIDNSGTVTGLIFGNATFTYTDSTTGCFETTTLVNVQVAPQITVQPTVAQAVCSGNSANLSVIATGAGLSYQWYKGSTPLTNGGNFFGVDSAALTINPISLTDASSDYYCVISGNCTPSVTSDSASLIVNEAVSITTQPAASQTYCTGNNVSIFISASGTGLTYQWFKGLNPLTDGGSISGANTNNLIINAASTSDAGNDYYCVVSGLAPCTSVNSSFSEVIIDENPSVTSQPATHQTVCAGSNVTFSVAATGGSLTYQWYNDTTPLTDNASVSGSNSATLTLNNVSLANVSAKYNCHITNSCGTIVSNYSALSINETPSILNNGLTVCSGESFSFSPVNGVPSVANIVPAGTTYSWSAPIVTGGMTGGTAQSGQAVISDVLVNNTNSVQTATYTITPLVGTCPGNTFELVISVNPEPYVNNAIQYVCSGDNFNFLPSNGSGNIVPMGATFSWGLPTTSGGITGASAQNNASSFSQTLTNTTNGVKTATYNITVNYGTCIGNTFTVTLFINPKPIVSALPVTQSICSGNNITNVALSTVFVVSEEVEYHWTRDNTTNIIGMASNGEGTIISGALTNTTNTPQTTTFTVIATTEEGCNSDSYLVTVLVNPSITVSATPSNQTICSGSTINTILMSNPNNVSGVTYSWTRNNTTNLTGIPNNGTGDTIAGIITNNTNTVQSTTFTITATANGCQTIINNVTITVNPKPTISGAPSTQTLCGGNSITPIVLSSGSGISGTTFSWTRDNTVNVSGINGSGSGNTITGVLNNTTSTNQTVTFTLSSSANGCASDNATAEVIVLPRPLLTATPSTQTICNNTAISTITLSSANSLPGTTFTWTRNNTANLTGIANSGTGNAISGTLVNNTSVTQTTTFTITVTAGNGCSNTTTASVTVYAPLTAPVIGSSQTACIFSTPSALSITTQPNGGSGVYTYQWQSSTDNVNFTNIAGATNNTYQPAFLNNGSDDVFYRLIINNTCGSVTSNVVFVEVVSNVGFTFDINNAPTGAVCPSTTFTPQISSLHLSTSAVRFNWTADANFISPSTGGPVGTTGNAFLFFRTSTGNIGPLTTQNNTNATVTTQITITPSVYNFPGPPSGAFLCSTSPQILNVTIRPRPVATATALENTICNGSGANIQVTGNITDANMTFSWTRNNTTNVSGTNSGTSGNIAPGGIFTIANTLTNNSANVQNVTFTITPSSNGCNGSPITVTISIAPTVTSGTIAANQTICSGGDPAAFTQTVAATGSNLTYQWQSSTDNITFTNITGATSVTYDAGTLTQTTWFRRITISTVNGKECYATSNTIQVNVNSINPGSISGNQTICSGGDPLAFTEVNATGGGTISYQWQSNTTGCSGSWTNITGANSATYDAPSGVTVTTYYRRMATSLLNSVACSDYSNCIVVTVNEVTGGLIADNQTLCGNNPAAFSVITPSTGLGTLSYQWQRSTTGCSGPWTIISGATGATYDAPSGLVATTYYQRITYSTLNGVQCSAVSNCITVTVNPVTGGAIGGNRTVCYGGDPNAFTENTAATGSNLTYQWQMSLVGGAGPWTDIAGATNTTYDEAGPIYQTTYFRRVVTATVNATSCTANSNFITVFVNNVTPPSIDGNQSVCDSSDSPSTFNVTIAATGTGTLTYQWQRSTVGCSGPWTNISGATSATYTPAPVTQTTYYQVRVTSTLNGVQCIAFSNCTEITSYAKTWNGSNSTDWNNPANWTPNGVPSAAHCVVIPNVTNDPIISGSNYEAFASRINLMSSAKLDVNTSNTLTVTNTVSVHSTASFNIKNGASLVQINDNAINTGNIKYTRTTRSMTRFAYVYWGSPVANNVFSQIPTQFDLKYTWQSGAMNGSWVPLTTTATGEGFITRVRNATPFNSGTGTIDFNFTGVPNNGLINVNVDSYDATSLVTGNTALLSNPYPSPIDAAAFLTHPNNTELGGTLFFWTSVTMYSGAGPYNFQDYASWNLTGSTATTPASDASNMSLLPNGKISSGQGFFAQVFADGQISFDNSMRVSGSNTQFFRNANSTMSEKHRIWLNLSNSQNKFRQTLIGYVAGATNELDRLYDGTTFTSNEINIYSLVNDSKLVIQGKALPFDQNDVVPVGYSITTAGDYTIAIDHMDGVFENNQTVYLKDKLLNVVHDIKTNAYSFATAAGTFDNRFEIVFNANTLGTGDLEGNNAVAYVKDNQLHIESVVNIKEIVIYELSGKKINTITNNDLDTSLSTAFNYPNGVYIIKVMLDNDVIVPIKVAK